MRRKEFDTELKVFETRRDPLRKEDLILTDRVRHIEKIKKLITEFSPAPIFIFESKSKIYVYTECLRVLHENSGKNLKEYIEKYSGFKQISELQLFCMDKVLGDDWDKKDGIVLPKKLVEEFEKENFFLPKTSICTKKGDVWEITDEKRGKTYYVIRNENEKLCIYNKPIDFDTFRNDLSEHIEKMDERGVINLGIQLRDELVPKEIQTELQNENEKIKDILIFCEKKDIDYLWEWIYWKEKNFFWGDKFHIGRIPKNYKFEKDSKFQIDTFTFLLDSSCHAACKKCKKSKKFLSELLEKIVKCKKIQLKSSKEFRHLKDCVHIGACGETFEKNPDYLKTFEGEISLNRPKFLFLNIFPKNASSRCGLLSEAINSAPPTIWIDSSLNIQDKFASAFVECFYEVFEKSLENNKEAKIVEIIAKTREKIEKDPDLGCNSFWRLAYVVNGNPSTTLITHV